MKYYLAIDIGASSGRHILSYMEGGKIVLEEVYRFKNGLEKKDGHLTWNIDKLFENILTGMIKCKELGKIPESVGIDTWGVDFVLLDNQNQVIGDAVGYRDSRTDGIDKEVYKYISEDDLYALTGIQKQLFNTIYQLMAIKIQNAMYLDQAKTFLMIPDYFHYLLTGKKCNEYTNASTTQLLNPETKDWDYDLINALGYPKDIFQELVMPGTFLGNTTKEISEKIGYECKVIIPATHDTASAVAAVPTNEDHALYISSGTWSLMGTEIMQANCSKLSQLANLTNEGGVDYRFRFLKNIMGMWMINQAKEELAPDMSFSELCDRASRCQIESIVDANDNRFLAPESMVTEVKNACKESGQEVPDSVDQVAAVIYNSLADCYRVCAKEIEDLLGLTFETIHVIGGGAQAEYLNRLTAQKCQMQVNAGPIEATAIGNIAIQMMAEGQFENLQEARRCIYKSFDIKTY